jgi:hypothetical protein
MKNLLKKTFVVIFAATLCVNHFGAELSEEWEWQSYTGSEYIATISKTGWVQIYFDKKDKYSIFPAGIALFSGAEGSQYENAKLKKITGKIENIANGKKFIISGNFLSGAKFLEKITCMKNSITIEYKVKPIPGKHEFHIMPIDCYKNGDKYWNTIFANTDVIIEQQGVKKKKNMKNSLKEGAGRVFEIRKIDPHVTKMTINNCFGRKIIIESLAKNKSHVYYDKGGENSNLRFEIDQQEDQGALLSKSMTYKFKYTFKALPNKAKLAEKTVEALKKQ